jgi:Lipid A 3-O-deacylase (PagL)
MEIPVDKTSVTMTLLALAWIVVIPTKADPQITMTRYAPDITGDLRSVAENTQLDAENARSPSYNAGPDTVLPPTIGSSVLAAFNPDQVFSRWAKVVSVEATFTHFGSHLDNDDAVIQAWNLSGRFALLPFGVSRMKFLSGVLDGALEIGLEPTFERFTTQHQNFGGVGLHLRYNLLHFRWGPLIPWIDASIAPGGTDLRTGRVSDETRLDGPFMNLIQAGVGESYFANNHAAIYFGLQAQHISSAGLNGSNRNYSLNTVESVVVGISWYLR